MKKVLLCGTLLASFLLPSLLAPKEAAAQLAPRPWVSVGVQDRNPTYSVGARALGFGVELGLNPAGESGVDVLKFLNVPFVDEVSPYVGVGLYDGDQNFGYSAGVQLNPSNRWMFGAGYHSIRGINGQIGYQIF